jgi:hypothetical protein
MKRSRGIYKENRRDRWWDHRFPFVSSCTEFSIQVFLFLVGVGPFPLFFFTLGAECGLGEKVEGVDSCVTSAYIVAIKSNVPFLLFFIVPIVIHNGFKTSCIRVNPRRAFTLLYPEVISQRLDIKDRRSFRQKGERGKFIHFHLCI